MEKKEQVPVAEASTTEPTTKKPRQVSEQHRQRISEARAQGRAINDMINLIRTNGVSDNGAKRSLSLTDIEKGITSAQEEINTATGVNAVKAAQRMLELIQAKTLTERMPDGDSVRIAFHAAAGEWSKRNKISYEAWKLLGVGDADLAAAGLRPA